MTYTSTLKLNGDDHAIEGDLSCKYNISGTTMTTKSLTSGNLSQEIVLENAGNKGLKLTLLGGLSPKHSLVASSEYIHPHLSLVADVNCIGTPAVKSSLTAGIHGVTGGVEADFDIDSKELKNLNGVIDYWNGNEHEATFMLLEKATVAKFRYFHIRNRDLSVAAEFEYNIAKDERTMTMGTQYEVDRDTTLKTKINSDGLCSLSYIQEIRKNTTLTLCSRFDVIKQEQDKSSHKFGLSLVIE